MTSSPLVAARLRAMAGEDDVVARLAGDDDNWLTAVFEADAETILRAGLPFAAALVAIRERAAHLDG